MEKSSEELTEEDKKENNTWGYYFCYFLVPFYSFFCDSFNKKVPYFEEYGHYSKTELENLEKGIMSLKYILN
jgi:hypothetical protein